MVLAASFLASFLAFAIEMIVAKSLLPAFGGSASVWTTCLMFFQGAVFAAGLYGWLSLSRPGRGIWNVHRVALALPLISFPFHIPSEPSSPGCLGVLWLLLKTAGPAFLVLSTTTIALQARRLGPAREPYRLYAASNAGAFSGLLAYPLLMEPFLDLGIQLACWYALYGLYVALVWLLLSKEDPAAELVVCKSLPMAQSLSWIALAAGPSLALLAITKILAYNLAAVPLLWVLPLSVYLLTLIRAFGESSDLPRRAVPALLVLVILSWVPKLLLHWLGESLGQELFRFFLAFALAFAAAVYLLALYCLAMACHWSLARSRPVGLEEMPRYYAMIALGGWLGGLVMAVLLPGLARGVFSLRLDWVIAFAACLTALAARHWRDALAFWNRAGWFWRAKTTAGVVLAATIAVLWFQDYAEKGHTLAARRNFYGHWRVAEHEDLRSLYHGNTIHGRQFISGDLRRLPLGYYHPHSPLGDVFDLEGPSFSRVAVVGLGVGSIAAYGRSGQAFDFFELDPDVAEVAQGFFSHLKESPAGTRIFLGDGRLSLARREEIYDLIVLDAFASDAIPVHLLTREAFELYVRRLAPNGMILCHVSSRFVDLVPALEGVAGGLGLYVIRKRSDQKDLRNQEIASEWVALSPAPAGPGRLVRERGWSEPGSGPRVRAWSDQRSSLLPLLRL